jgi:hypothetical protein
MNKINNYDDLLFEKVRLETKILEEKESIRESLTELKEKLSPLLLILPVLSFFKKGKTGGFLKTGVSLGMGWLVGRKLLSKSRWLTNLFVPKALKQAPGSVTS